MSPFSIWLGALIVGPVIMIAIKIIMIVSYTRYVWKTQREKDWLRNYFFFFDACLYILFQIVYSFVYVPPFVQRVTGYLFRQYATLWNVFAVLYVLSAFVYQILFTVADFLIPRVEIEIVENSATYALLALQIILSLVVIILAAWKDRETLLRLLDT